MGIHYDYKSTRGAKAMEKQAKREKKLAEKRAKKNAKTGFVKNKDEDKTKTIQDLSSLIGATYDVVFLDSITTLLTGGKYSYKDAEFAIPLYKLNDLACEKNIPIIFSSHLKKPEHNERITVNKHDVMGNQSIYAAASDDWSIHKK